MGCCGGTPHRTAPAKFAGKVTQAHLDALPPPVAARKLSLWEMATGFVSAITGGRVPLDVFVSRLTICRANSCGQYVDEDGMEYCKGCGCPRWRMAELSSKLWWARLSCPLESPKWGKHE